ncbi:MAG: DoxX family protein [Pseudomonadota bacterium]
MLKQLVTNARTRALALLDRISWLAPLVGRFAVGLLFLSTGWGKAHSLDKVTHFFISLHIPMPALNAVVVAYSELICGGLLLLGLCTRLATVPLIVSMIVAILTAKLADIHNIFDLVGADEFTYLCVLIMLALIGPGKVSLDRVLSRRMGWATRD